MSKETLNYSRWGVEALMKALMKARMTSNNCVFVTVNSRRIVVGLASTAQASSNTCCFNTLHVSTQETYRGWRKADTSEDGGTEHTCFMHNSCFTHSTCFTYNSCGICTRVATLQASSKVCFSHILFHEQSSMLQFLHTKVRSMIGNMFQQPCHELQVQPT